MRRYCPVETYADNYVEFSESWSRADIRDFAKTTRVMIEIMQRKITDINLRLTDGTVIISPDDITEENLDKMQWEVFQWFIVLPQLVVKEILDLGEAVRHQLLLTPEESPVTEPSANSQLMPTS